VPGKQAFLPSLYLQFSSLGQFFAKIRLLGQSGKLKRGNNDAKTVGQLPGKTFLIKKNKNCSVVCVNYTADYVFCTAVSVNYTADLRILGCFSIYLS